MSEPTVVVINDKPEESPAVDALQETVETLAETVEDLAEKVGEGEPTPEPKAGDDTALAVTVGALVARVDSLTSEVEGLKGALEAALEEPEPEPEPEAMPVELPPVPDEPPKPPTFWERCTGFVRDCID